MASWLAQFEEEEPEVALQAKETLQEREPLEAPIQELPQDQEPPSSPHPRGISMPLRELASRLCGLQEELAELIAQLGTIDLNQVVAYELGCPVEYSGEYPEDGSGEDPAEYIVEDPMDFQGAYAGEDPGNDQEEYRGEFLEGISEDPEANHQEPFMLPAEY